MTCHSRVALAATLFMTAGAWAQSCADLVAHWTFENHTLDESSFGNHGSPTGTISYVGSLLGEQTRTATARVTLANPQMAWRPGLAVNVEIISSQAEVPVAVTVDAVQSVNDSPTVFVKVENGFIPQPVVTGRSDGKMIEIVKGLKPGSRYAAAGSFVIKAEQGKGSAEHTH